MTYTRLGVPKVTGEGAKKEKKRNIQIETRGLIIYSEGEREREGDGMRKTCIVRHKNNTKKFVINVMINPQI